MIIHSLSSTIEEYFVDPLLEQKVLNIYRSQFSESSCRLVGNNLVQEFVLVHSVKNMETNEIVLKHRARLEIDYGIDDIANDAASIIFHKERFIIHTRLFLIDNTRNQYFKLGFVPFTLVEMDFVNQAVLPIDLFLQSEISNIELALKDQNYHCNLQLT